MAAVRYEGRLKKWNAERGFGFIGADDSGQDVFVHISAFPRDGRLPVVGEALSFEVEPDDKGKRRAVRVERAGAAQPVKAPSSRPRAIHLSRAPKKSSFRSRVIALAMLAAVGGYGYGHYAARVAQIRTAAPGAVPGAVAAMPAPTEAPITLLPGMRLAVPADFRCDGRKYCSQMTSCREATLFLQNCPGVEMDGNHDGLPCEQQWCR